MARGCWAGAYDKASIGKDIKSILTLYKDLQSLSKTCREILVLILLKGGDGRYRSDTISINTRKLEDVANMATHELKAQVDQLIDLNIASVDDDGPTRIILQRTLKGSDLDFFYQIKNFCGTEERLKTTLVNLNFTTLD